MRLALYQPWIYLHGGLERSLLELVKRSRHQWTIYTGYYDKKGTFPEFQNYTVIELKKLSVKRDILSVLGVALKIMTQTIDMTDHDALVVWCDGMGDMITFKNNTKPVFNICSTPLRAVFDPAYIEQALSQRGLPSKIAFKLFQMIFKMADQLAWKRYKGVIATSTEVKDRIVSGGLKKDDCSMKLFYPGIDWNACQGPKQYDPFLLVPGRIMWTKNIELAIDAFIKANMSTPWRLVIAGFLDQKSRQYFNDLKLKARVSRQIEFEISPSDARLTELYQKASAVLFPPRNEDWGIVPLEAMANGKPVLANNAGGPKESIIHNETGWLLSPDPDSWADVIVKICNNPDLVKTMGEKARAHSRQYDWSEFVNGVDSAIEQWMRY